MLNLKMSSFNHLNDVLVHQLMFLSTFLGVMLNAHSPNQSIFEFLEQVSMNAHTEALHVRVLFGKDNWLLVVREQPFWLGVDS